MVLSILGIILEAAFGELLPVEPTLLRSLRIFRVLRVLRLVKGSRHIRILLETLWHSIPALGNIFAFLCLVFFIYSVLGVSMFGEAKHMDYLNRRCFVLGITNILVASLPLLVIMAIYAQGKLRTFWKRFSVPVPCCHWGELERHYA